MNQLSFRNLVGVAYSDAEVKAMAEEQEARKLQSLRLPLSPLQLGHGRAERPG